jgi:predicted metal-dependent peptidase
MNNRIQQSLTTLILDAPFFATLALNLKIEETTDDTNCPTMQTNGTILRINLNFLHTLPDPEITFVIAHEVLHCALGHVWRRNAKDPQQWNIACDFVVNEHLQKHIQETKTTCMKMPTSALINPNLFDKSAEEIYGALPDVEDQQEQPCGTFTDAQEESDGEGNGENDSPVMTEADWCIAAVQATNAQKKSDGTQPGTEPSNLERLIKERIEPSIPWTDLLRQYCDTITRDDYTWSVPNTRYIHTGFTLPTLRSESLGPIVIAIDTSMSVNDALLATFLSETQSLLDSAKPESITIVSCDYKIHNPQTYLPGDKLTQYIPVGGGGTDFNPVFNYIKKQSIDPLVLIYFTDGEGSFPEEPHYPTLWLHFGQDVDYPFGHKIDIPK